jgi:TRAP-type C4-dicarboxylate transport system permease large subunit
LPVLGPAGIDPVHFGVVITLNMMIGLCTPPFGVLLFVVSSMTKTPLAEVIREIWPYIWIMIVTLAILVFVPDLVLLVPRALGYAQ